MSKKDTTLLQSLERSGALGLTKAYLQTQILENLRNQNSASSNLSKALAQSKNKNIFSLLRLAYSVIYDFLIKMNLSYSQSTFNNEMKELLSNSNIPFSDSEIVNLLNVNITEFENAKQNLLNDSKDPIATLQGNKLGSTFIFYLMKKNSQFLKSDIECQTDINLLNVNEKNENLSPSINNEYNFMNVEEKLKQIEDKNNNKVNLESNFPSQLIENRFIKYKEECEKRYQDQLNNEMNRFKNIELSEMRIEENKKYVAKLQQMREEYDKEYNEKLEELKKEKNNLKNKERNLELDYEKKQSDDRKILDDKINFLKEKENDLQKKYENELKDIEVQKDKLKFKEQEIDYMKETHVSKLQNEINKIRNEYETKLNEEKKKLEDEREELSKQKFDKNSYEQNKNYNYTINENNNSEFRNELDNMRRTLDDMRDKYSKTMSENLELKDKIYQINRNISQIQNDNNNANLLRGKQDSNMIDNNTYQILAKNENDVNTLREQFKDLKREVKKEIKKHSPSHKNIDNSNLYNSSNLNQSLPIQNSHYRSQKIMNPNIQKKYNNTQKMQRKISPNLAKELIGFKDRRKILQQLEEEQYKLNNEIRNEFQNLNKNDVPMVILNSDEIENIKKNNYYNVIIDEEREKELNELYRQQNNNERLVDKIKFINNYDTNYRNANENNKDSKIIVINKENPEKQTQIINYYERKQSNNQSKNSQSSSLNEIKKAENDSNKQESKFTPMYDENRNSINNVKKSKNEENENKTPLISSITAIPAPQNNNDNTEYNDINIKNTIYINDDNKNIKNSKNEIPSSNGIGGILSNQNQYQKQPSSNSIREEIEESINNNSRKVNNSQSTNKFQNVNYEDNNDYNNYNDFNNNSKFNKDQSEIEEEYNDFEDVSGNFDRKPSDIDKKSKSNISISGIMKNSSIKESIAGQKRNSEIEENIEKESISSNQYNDFETSNNLIKKGITGNTSSGNQAKTLSEGEIKEEINYDDDY